MESVELNKKTENIPKVSVIIPVYKEKYLVQCLNSVVNQTLREIEIIIVDKGKKNRCQEIVDYYAAQDARIVAPHIVNDGYGASANIGLKFARGEYISIVESDDFIEPEMYEEMYSYAKKLDADVVKTPCYEYFNDRPKQDCCYRKFMRENTPQNMCFSMKDFGEMLQIHASIWSGIYRTEYMKQNNIEFVEAPGAGYIDVGFRIQSLIHSNRIAWLDKPYYNYRIDSSESSTNTYNLTTMLKRWQEVHDYFKDYQDDYDKYYGKYLILDEYNNSILIASIKDVTEEDKKLMEYNFSFVSENMIKNTESMTKDQKTMLLEFKKDPDRVIGYLQNVAHRNISESTESIEADLRFKIPENMVASEDKVVIYGAGVVGKTYIKQILKNRNCHLMAVCDKNYSNIKLPSISVISPDELSRWNENQYDMIVIANEKKEIADAIREELKGFGIPPQKIKWGDPKK